MAAAGAIPLILGIIQGILGGGKDKEGEQSYQMPQLEGGPNVSSMPERSNSLMGNIGGQQQGGQQGFNQFANSAGTIASLLQGLSGNKQQNYYQTPYLNGRY